MRPAEPPPDHLSLHHLRHAHQMVARVLQRDGALLTREEKASLKRLVTLPVAAASLVVRLFLRRPGWQRRSTLRYAEVPNLPESLAVLEQAGWLERWPGEPSTPVPAEILATLNHAELRHLLLKAGQPAGLRASLDRQRVAELISAAPQQRQLGMWDEPDSRQPGPELLDHWVRLQPSRLHLLQVVELCHFGQRGQGLAAFTLEGLGLLRHVQVRCQGQGLFQARDEVESLLDDGRRLDALLEGLADVVRQLRGWRVGRPLPAVAARDSRLWLAEAWDLAAPLRLPSAGPAPADGPGQWQLRRVRLKALSAGAALLERLGRYGAAAAWRRLALSRGLEGRRRGEAWQRLVVDLRHSGRGESAVEALQMALGETLDPLARRELERLAGVAESLGKAPVLNARLSRHPGHRSGRVLVRDPDGAALCAEEAALRHLAREGWTGLHAENTLFRALVGLLAWDLIFLSVKGAFLHSMQSHPLDWGRPGFLARRQQAWRKLERQLRREEHRPGVKQRLEACEGLQNPLVDWSRLARDAEEAGVGASPLWQQGLNLMLERISGPVLVDLCALLLEHPGACGHGFPDLLVWREESAMHEWLLVEVKGPGDQLFATQRWWHHWMLERGLPLRLLRL